MLQECLTLKDKKQCPNCNYQIDKEDKFCPKCGQKQNQQSSKEVEVLEKTIEMESALDTADKVETEFTDPVENLQESNYDESNEEKKDK